MKDQHADEPDPVRRLLWECYDAFAPALGERNPACRAVYLADLARLVAAAQAANESARPAAPDADTRRLDGAEVPGEVERALRRMAGD